MNNTHARILVIGAGVNGSICAAGLHDAGQDVTLLARGTHFKEVQEQGVVIEDPFTQKRIVSRVPVTDHLNPEDIYDYVLVVVRKNQVPGLLPVLAQNRSPNIVFMVNNPSGPEEWVHALGRERVMLGFAFAGGRREGSLIHAMRSDRSRTPFGEIDGSITPRLVRLVLVFRRAGFNVGISRYMTDWLATHAALVAPIGNLALKYGCNTRALAGSQSDLALVVDAMRESLDVLRAVGRRVTPLSMSLIKIVPRFFWIAVFRRLLSSKLGEVGIGWHCSQAPDEIQQLVSEVEVLVDKSGLRVPALKRALAIR
jgi:2-dehydropantoate 2-reductase